MTNRRRMDSEANSRIMEAIAQATDESQRIMLLLLLEISNKIDAVLNDESVLRQIVLNGHSETHHEDHRFIATLRDPEGDFAKWMQTGGDRARHGGYCDWAAKQQELQRENGAEKRKLIWGWAGQATWALTLLAAGAIGSKYMGT